MENTLAENMTEETANLPMKERLDGILEGFLDKGAKLIQSTADLKAEEEDTRMAELKYLESLALELALLLDSPALRDMPLEEIRVFGEAAKMFKFRKRISLYRKEIVDPKKGHQASEDQVRILAIDTNGQLWKATDVTHTFERVDGPLTEELAFADTIKGRGHVDVPRTFSTRLAYVTEQFAKLVAGCRVTHENALIDSRKRREVAQQNTRSL